MKAEDIIIKTMKRPARERGIRIAKPNDHLSDGHMKKADHNLIVMTDMNELRHEDWVIIAAYYSMYHASLSLLTKIGLESKDHATSVAVLEYFFGKEISNEMVGKFNEAKDRKDKIDAMIIGEKYIDYLWRAKQAREAVQYGVSVNYRETGIAMRNARDFVGKIKDVNGELDDKAVLFIQKKISGMKARSISAG